MRAPEFWAGDRLIARALDPFGRAFGWAGRLRRRLAHPSPAPVPLICIGNLTVGGTGKTPTVLALARRLIDRGHRPHLLSRGHGGRARGPLRVEPERHDAVTVGDEALLLAAMAPTWIARDRLAGARAAADAGAELVIMDDGWQNPHLLPDLGLIVIDGGYGFGNRRLLPAGPLRETVERGLARADATVVIGRDRVAIDRQLPEQLPRLHAELCVRHDAPDLAGRRVVAFAGIGRPDKFFETIVETGAELVARHAFADHHGYRRHELAALVAEAERAGALCLTTLKDHVRLPREFRGSVAVLPIELRWAEPNRLDRLVTEALRSHRITLC